MKTSDFLVIGAGVAGLSFALRAAEHGKVAVITKGKFLDCSSAKAQGGIAAVWDRNDSFEDHIADTLDAGAGLCNEQAVRTIVEEGPGAIRELLEWGVNFDPGNQGEDYELAREGGHTKRRILHAKDATGLEITSKLLEAAKLHPNIQLLEDHFAIDLITTTKLGLVTEDRVLGAYVLDRAATRLRMLHREVKDFYWGYRITPDILELRNLVAVASLIVDCAMRRNESRGLHFNTDYPGKLDHRFVTQLHRW